MSLINLKGYRCYVNLVALNFGLISVIFSQINFYI